MKWRPDWSWLELDSWTVEVSPGRVQIQVVAGRLILTDKVACQVSMCSLSSRARVDQGDHLYSRNSIEQVSQLANDMDNGDGVWAQ